ncbi:MAG: DUF3500 domain-containing protein [Verrucomicrobiota bacterium]
MKLCALPLLAGLLFVGVTPAETHKAWTLASEVFAETKPAETDHSPKEMVAAAEAFLKSLTDEQRKLALLAIDDPERKKWTNTPPRGNEGGLRLGDLDKDQLEAACAFLSTVMSERGYLMSRNIMLADDLLLDSKEEAEELGGFGSANYWVAIFGTPSETEPWAVQWDGHHVGVNLAIVGEKVTMSPSFIGTQPRQFKLGEELIVPMGEETAQAYAFIDSLTEKQREEAIRGDKRRRMVAGPGKDGTRPELPGLSCKGLDPEQRAELMKLVSLWVDDLPPASATLRMKEIEAQLDDTVFTWNGPFAVGSDMSFHLSGPGVVIEYAGQDLGGDPLDHLHSIYRDPTNEYGARWVR